MERKVWNRMAYYKDDDNQTVMFDRKMMELPKDAPIQLYISINSDTTMPETIKAMTDFIEVLETMIEEERMKAEEGPFRNWLETRELTEDI